MCPIPARRSSLLLGPRPTGKRTLVHVLLPQKSWTLDLLHHDVFLRFSKDPSQFRREAEAKIRSRIGTIFVDVVQKVPELLDEVHALIEQTRARFILTGSSARRFLQRLDESAGDSYQFHEVTCYECHDAHNTEKNQIRTTVNQTEGGKNLAIQTKNYDNTLCLSCHATHGPFAKITKQMVFDYDKNLTAIAKEVEAHTHHTYAPDRKMGLSRCTKCHMPLTASSGPPYDISSHTFEPVPPQKTILYQGKGGMPNACAVSCHRNIVDIFPNTVDTDISKWTEKSDVKLAEWLQEYFGPKGKWWKLDVTAPK